MTTWSLERKLAAAFALVAAVAGLSAAVAYRASRGERESDAGVSQAWEVQAGLHELKALTAVSRDAVWGFLITGQESYLEPSAANRPRITKEIAGLRVLTAANAAQQGRLQELDELVARQWDIQDALVQAAREHGLDAARQSFATGAAEAGANAIVKVIEEMVAAEERLLRERHAAAAAARRRSQATSGVLAAVMAAILLGAFLVVRHHLAEQRRAESERDCFFTLALDMLCIAGTDGYFKRLNPAFTETLGYSMDELLARPFRDLVHPDDQAATLRKVEGLAAGQPTVQFENRYRRKDGSWRWLSWRAMPGPGGRIYATARDITETKDIYRQIQNVNEQLVERVLERTAELEAANRALVGEVAERRHMEGRYRGLLEAAPDAMVVVNEGGEIVLLNVQAEKQFGYRRDELVGQKVKNIIPEGFAERLIADGTRSAADALAQQIGTGIELSARRKDGSEFPIEIMLSPLESAEGILVTAAIRDISVRKGAERHLAHMEGRYRGLLEAAPDAMVVVNEGGEIVLLNVQAEKQFGYRRDELVGQKVKNIIPEGFAERLIADGTRSAADALAQQIGTGIELSARRKDGSEFPIEIMLSPLESAEGILVTAAIRDISERRQMEAQLQQSQRLEAIGQLAGGVAHDFNNILGVIVGYGEMAQRQLGSEHPVRARVDEMVKAAERAASLTRQLLAFSRKQVMQLKLLDLNDLVRDTHKMLGRLISEDIAVVVHPAPGLGTVKADPAQIEQIILNLAVNARDAMPKGGTLTLETANVDLDEDYAAAHPPVKPGRHVMLAVSDTGIGMDEETQQRIFEPFFTTKPEGQGTGLGLATVYGIVKQSGGYIWVYSEPGRGTTFKVYLPRVDEPAETATPAGPPAEAPRGHETILLVEDTETLQEVIREMLEESGYTVLLASNGEEALALARECSGPIDLLLTDVVMPKLGGKDLAKLLSASRPGIRVLYISGYTSGAISHHGVLADGVVLLEKPFTAEKLARAVREALDRPTAT